MKYTTYSFRPNTYINLNFWRQNQRETLISAVVQIRLDFETFVVRQPETTGSCDDDTIKFTTPTGNGMALPTLCGTLTDQHSKYHDYLFYCL